MSRTLLAVLACCGTLLPQASGVITLKVYWEALCPTSQEWMLSKYKPMWEKQDFKKLFKVEHYAYGNAKTSALGTISCQHGTKECDANKMITCSQKKITDAESSTRFLFCSVEKLKQNTAVRDTVVACAADSAVSTNIINCYTGSEGNSLQAAVATATITHSYVPWVTDANGVQLKSAENNLQRYLCANADASGRPSECNFAVMVRSESRSDGDTASLGCSNPYNGEEDNFAGIIEGLDCNMTNQPNGTNSSEPLTFNGTVMPENTRCVDANATKHSATRKSKGKSQGMIETDLMDVDY